MVKSAAAIPSPSLTSPPTTLNDLLTIKKWPKGQAIHRIHGDIYRHDELCQKKLIRVAPRTSFRLT
jgi:hypothetical protein